MKQIKFWALVASVFLYIGCGGGGSTTTASKLAIDTNAKAIAYKSKNGDWKSIDVNSSAPAADGLREYMVNRDDKFMVALKCSTKTSYLFALSKDDGDIKFKCSKLTLVLNKKINGNLDDTVTAPPLKGFITAIGTKWAFENSAPYSYNYTIEQGIYDLIAVSLDSASEPARFYIKRAINLNQNKTLNVSMNNTNSCSIKSKNFNAGANFRIVYISKGNTYFTSSNGGKWYYPNCTQDSDDIYALVGKDNTGNKVRLKTEPVNSMTKADIGAQDLTHINALTQLAYQNSGQISGLSHYLANSNSPELELFIIDMKSGANQHYTLFLSKKYLESDDVFDLPKLSAISEFSSVWDGDNATNVDAQAVMSDTKLGDILKGKMLLLSEIFTFATKSCTVEFSKQKVK